LADWTQESAAALSCQLFAFKKKTPCLPSNTRIKLSAFNESTAENFAFPPLGSQKFHKKF